MEPLVYDLRLAVRSLSRRPGLCVLAAGSLAVGIAINVAVFTIFGAILLRPLGVPAADSLLLIGSPTLTFAQQDTLREAVAAQGEVFGFRMGGPVSLDHGPEDVPLAMVTPNHFSALGLRPALGTWPVGSLEAGGEVSLVLSHSLWRRRFAADPQVIGRKVRLGTLPAQVAAVGPPGFRGLGPMAADAWRPASIGDANPRDPFPGWNALVRVRPGLSPGQARPFVESALLALPGVAGTGTSRTQVNATPLVEIQRLVWILITVFMAVPGLVLLVACANVSGLLAARAEERREEMAVRLAIGGGRGRLVRQLLAEGALLAAGGAALGLLAARWMVDGISPWLLPALANYGIYPELFLDTRAIALAVGLAGVATLAASLLPALATSKADLTPLLKREVAAFGRGRRFRYREALAIGQLVVTFAFVATAVLCARSFSRNLDAPLGFLPDRVLTMFVAFPEIPPGPVRAQRIEDVLASVRALPAVARTTLASSPPAVPTREVALQLPGAGAGDAPVRAGFNAVRPEFWALTGARLQRGRLLDEADVRFDQPVAVVTAALAQRLWPESDPVGQSVTIGDAGVAATIVGVVADPAEVARVEHSAGKPAAPTLYVPLGKQLLGSSGGMNLVVEGRGPLGPLGSEIVRLVADRHPGAVVAGVRTIADVNRAGMIQSEIASVTYSVLGTLCGLLGAVGLYGSLAQLVLRRTHEFGIRRALGATAKDVFRLVLRRGSTLALVAIGLGVPTAFAVARIFGSAVPDLPALDLLTLGVGCGLVVALALAAAYFPARRATLVDPMIALRHD